jgi:glycine/D-amino acid oxidase-like deaminating enzyme/nitrite reductase/ring-hydroxylating ferredoxin subunit
MSTISNTQGTQTPLWQQYVDVPALPTLDKDIQADVLIIGGGISGLATAYMLLQEGIKAVIVEMAEVCGGNTLLTTAHLASVLDDRFTELKKYLGEEGARLAAISHKWAIDEIERICSSHNFTAADFRRVPGYLFLSAQNTEEELDEEIEAARQAAFPEAVKQNITTAEVGWQVGPAGVFQNQGQFNPAGYTSSLTKYLLENGVKIYINTRVTAVHDQEEPVWAETASGHTILARKVVVATASPINTFISIHTMQAPYRSYAVAASVPSGSIQLGLYWDMADPYHYIRLQPDGDKDWLIVGGEDHRAGMEKDPKESLDCLKDWARQKFPQITDFQYQWSGQVYEPYDLLAYLGQCPGCPNTYIITGDSGHGMTHSHIGARICTDLIMGRESEFAQLYSPSRVTLKAGMEYIVENTDVAANFAEYVTPGEVTRAGEIAPGEGAIYREGVRKVAVYKDDAGQLHELSAVCPHAGCIVHWNGLEKSWDCPCHGSRFKPTGEVIHGPAASGLERLHQDKG